jgi:serine/threonine protein kinase
VAAWLQSTSRLKHDRPVALKVLKAELAVALGPERFVREVRTTARLQHPHILPPEPVPGLSATLGEARSRSFPCPAIFSRSLKRR